VVVVFIRWRRLPPLVGEDRRQVRVALPGLGPGVSETDDGAGRIQRELARDVERVARARDVRVVGLRCVDARRVRELTLHRVMLHTRWSAEAWA
jgi:hypothetical protein